ncbi:putative hydrolase of the HAD superfamily [Bradyrhizobium japonicum]|jgi:putative hydrolase of the HAD superfamily|uniref:HAD family hydrolase n=1 Tax=Bradyrhizobium TaxID=374 RepID=UPI000379212E|nr:MULTISPECIES: HAD-IA family hydrolase [Bradyrhizobium]MCP1730103.1 putative hydrolase of the HAD superfamily [Bradyrhizobium elkanii]MCP1930558.1 putative hydrolase of the HAD superfamily [Bradyrhizobium elkanii]MCP1970871.1 putative hydrolase of the HAD superfamily [Bradyrhizobium elkanii]MCS3481184.1 putative hydrolase of the HAD superfamily [Bradyrhizobium elkanii]MCS3518028.1 putative hydrolase of the HAD superfamily [Bradyrhizobium elkanii]
MRRQLAQALVLDFGGVISKTLFETHDLTERTLGLAPCTLKWLGPFAPDSDPLWTSMQRGEISERDYWLTRSREVGRLVGEDWRDMETFVKRARGADPDTVIRPEAARAITLAADAGLRLAILSNELDLFYGADFRSRLSILKRFDTIVDATHTGILKPDPRAYQSVLDELALEADNCVFVDDQRRNIAGAAACNMRTVLFDVRNPATSYSEALRHFGLQFD